MRPFIEHRPPAFAKAGAPLALWLEIAPPKEGATIRLYYRPVNQLAKFKVLEAPASRPDFTIPGEDVSSRWDLMYYFEVLNRSGSGWFLPDPQDATPYYVIPTRD